MCRLNINKGTGLDNLPAKFLKDSADVLKSHLAFIINLSIATERVPDDMKHARITPIFKKNNKFDVGNYRPVSVLSIASKLLERAVNTQLQNYLSQNKLLFQYQSGFRGNHSTDSCLIHLQDHIRSHTALGEYTGMVLLDIQKAFDCVDHNILCAKLKALGIASARWFESYLSDRSQTVVINGVSSESCKVTCGVPQGSILGPLLFLVYMNDMPSSVSISLFQYADDSAILVSGKNVNDISQILSSNLSECYNWLVDNKLSMHPGKTELILFGSKNRLKKVKNFEINFQGFVTKTSKNVKYLGLILDQFLSGEKTVNDIVNKVNSRIKFLYRQTHFMKIETKKLLASAIVVPHFDYAIASWYCGLTKTLQNKLQLTQNRVIRFILNLHPKFHLTGNEFRRTNLLNLSDRAKQLRLNHVYSIYNNTCPPYMKTNFIRLHDLHSHNTRGNKVNYYVPKIVSETYKSFFYNAIADWNDLPCYIKNSNSKEKFKYLVKKHLKLSEFYQ